MSNLILHHYPLSPFSEKMRTLFGYAGIDWLSVITTEMPPRPVLDPLAGGYRRIPVAQIGADVFCDTRTITSEVARISGRPELTLENCNGEVQQYVEQADLQIFFACMLTSMGLNMGPKMAKSVPVSRLARIAWDRINLGRTIREPRIGIGEARNMMRAHLNDLEQRLTGNFLFGDTPNIADFSAYHGLWYVCDVADKDLLGSHSKVRNWMSRIRAFGHGNRTDISGDEAWAIAHGAHPRPLPETAATDALCGKLVEIAPSDYGLDPVTGKLVACTDQQWIISRDDPRVEKVHVHFPRQRFTLTPC